MALNCCEVPVPIDTEPGEIFSNNTLGVGDCDPDLAGEPAQLLHIAASIKRPTQQTAFINAPDPQVLASSNRARFTGLPVFAITHASRGPLPA
jgi:hypothetical protein